MKSVVETVTAPAVVPRILVEYGSGSESESASGKEKSADEEPMAAGSEHKVTYKDKLALIAMLLDTELEITPAKGSAYGGAEGEATARLPPATRFKEYLQGYEAELMAQDGSKRAKSHPGAPYELHKGPGRPHVRMSCYEVAKPAWRKVPSGTNSLLTSPSDKTLYRPSCAPFVRLDQKKVAEWEAIERDNLSIQSHTDWFIKGSMAGLDQVFQDLSHRATIDKSLESLANTVADMRDLLESAGTGVHHLALNSVHLTGSMLMARRDSYLDIMKDKISKENLFALRFGDLQGPYLFDPSALEAAKRDAERRRADSKQDQLIEALKSTASGPRSQNKATDDTFVRKPFQAKQPPFQYNRGNRGGGNGGYRGRGNRGGQGRGTPKSNGGSKGRGFKSNGNPGN